MGVLYLESLTFLNKGITRHEPDIVGDIKTQISLKAGLKIWVKKGRDEIHSKMKQLHMRDTLLPLHWKNMSQKKKNQTLDSHLFLK